MSIDYVSPLTKDEYINAKADFRTIKESKEIADHIVNRALYVFDKIATLLNLKYTWVVFDIVDLESYQGVDVGHYDYQRYIDTFSFFSDIDDLEYKNKVIDLYFNKFPSKYIYEEFEDEVLGNIESLQLAIDLKKERAERKRKREKDKAKDRNNIRPEVIASIRSKLTELELSFIEFK